jgi:hypothetical protein
MKYVIGCRINKGPGLPFKRNIEPYPKIVCSSCLKASNKINNMI